LSLYRVGEVWYIDVASQRGRVRRSAGTTDKKEAQEYHDKVKEELWRQDKLGESPPVTWGEAVKRWLDVKPRGMPDKYRLRSLGISLSEPLPISAGRIDQLLATHSAGSWNRTLALLVAIHNCSSVPPPAVKRKPMAKGRTRWLDLAEWHRLQRALKEESPLLEQAARFTLATGLRENNVLELDWSQIDLGRRVAWFYADQMKGRVEHGIPLNDAALGVLRERKGIHKRWVFGNPDYPLTKASNRAWYNALRKSKLKETGVVWHTLRHTWASWAVMSGVRLEELMKLGGWKTYSMVLRYAHLAPEHMAEAAAKVRPVSRLRHKGSLAQR
jgi:integrase